MNSSRYALIFCSLIALLSTGCSKSEPKSQHGESCAKTADCDEGMTCQQQVCIDANIIAAQQKEMQEQAAKRTAEMHREKTAKCQNWTGCKKFGECSYDRASQKCVAGENLGCLESDICEKSGKCSFSEKNGRCSVQSDEDCNESGKLVKLGKTHAKDGYCMATDETCGMSPVCEEKGLCAAVNERLNHIGAKQTKRCAARTDEGCKNSKVCKKEGKCRVELMRGRGDYQFCVKNPVKPQQ